MSITITVTCIKDSYDDYNILFLTVGKKYTAEYDEKHQPDSYWLVNDAINYRPYKKYLFLTENEIRQQKLKKLQCLK